MDTRDPYLLHLVNIVVTAEHHDPSILNPLFLENNRIVPENWRANKSEVTSIASSIQYDRTILKMDASRFEIAEAVDGPFREGYDIHKIADAYLSRVAYIPYRDLGLNCTVCIKEENPEQWLRQRFLCPGAWLEGDPYLHIVQMSLAVQTDDDLLCALSFHPGNSRNNQTNTSSKVVVVTVHINHPGPLNAESIREAIRKWPKKQELIRSTLDKVVGISV